MLKCLQFQCRCASCSLAAFCYLLFVEICVCAIVMTLHVHVWCQTKLGAMCDECREWSVVVIVTEICAWMFSQWHKNSPWLSLAIFYNFSSLRAWSNGYALGQTWGAPFPGQHAQVGLKDLPQELRNGCTIFNQPNPHLLSSCQHSRAFTPFHACRVCPSCSFFYPGPFCLS